MYTSHIEGESLESSYPSTGLLDSPALEMALSDEDHAAMAADARDFDPLYAREVERDEAEALLAKTFPDTMLSLSPNSSAIYYEGRWTRKEGWLCVVHGFNGDKDVYVSAATPLAAVEAVIKAHAKANAPVRTTPEHRQLSASTFEAFGRIAPETAADFLELVEQHHGRSDFLEVLQDGRVLLAREYVEGSEAQAIGGYVAQHLINTSSTNAEDVMKVVVEPSGDIFRAFIVLPSGERRKVAGAFVSELDARSMAQTAILSMRSTIVTTAAIVASEQSAA